MNNNKEVKNLTKESLIKLIVSFEETYCPNEGDPTLTSHLVHEMSKDPTKYTFMDDVSGESIGSVDIRKIINNSILNLCDLSKDELILLCADYGNYVISTCEDGNSRRYPVLCIDEYLNNEYKEKINAIFKHVSNLYDIKRPSN